MPHDRTQYMWNSDMGGPARQANIVRGNTTVKRYRDKNVGNFQFFQLSKHVQKSKKNPVCRAWNKQCIIKTMDQMQSEWTLNFTVPASRYWMAGNLLGGEEREWRRVLCRKKGQQTVREEREWKIKQEKVCSAERNKEVEGEKVTRLIKSTDLQIRWTFSKTSATSINLH